MSDTIISIIAEEAVQILVPLVLGAFGLLGSLALAKLTQWLGAKRAQELREGFAAAAKRAIANAESKGLTGEALKRDATAYLQRTMAETIKKLGASEAQVEERVSAEAAVREQTPPPAVIVAEQP